MPHSMSPPRSHLHAPVVHVCTPPWTHPLHTQTPSPCTPAPPPPRNSPVRCPARPDTAVMGSPHPTPAHPIPAHLRYRPLPEPPWAGPGRCQSRCRCRCRCRCWAGRGGPGASPQPARSCPPRRGWGRGRAGGGGRSWGGSGGARRGGRHGGCGEGRGVGRAGGADGCREARRWRSGGAEEPLGAHQGRGTQRGPAVLRAGAGPCGAGGTARGRARLRCAPSRATGGGERDSRGREVTERGCGAADRHGIPGRGGPGSEEGRAGAGPAARC